MSPRPWIRVLCKVNLHASTGGPRVRAGFLFTSCNTKSFFFVAVNFGMSNFFFSYWRVRASRFYTTGKMLFWVDFALELLFCGSFWTHCFLPFLGAIYPIFFSRSRAGLTTICTWFGEAHFHFAISNFSWRSFIPRRFWRPVVPRATLSYFWSKKKPS